PLPLDEPAVGVLTHEAREMLRDLFPALSAVDPWTAAGAEGAVRSFAESRGLKLGKVAQPLRAALTGRTVSPGVFDVVAILGREESLARILDQTAKPD